MTDPTRAARSAAASPPGRPLSLALQGGGAFGAFTWGVLDRLLEESDIVFDSVSGASAGAVNAVVMADGLRRGGREGARESLDVFWTALADKARSGFLSASPPTSLALDLSTRILSPYQMNPFDLNPLRTLLSDAVDFEALAAASPVRLVVSATRVSDGGLRIFREHEMTRDVVLASACLPLMNHAVTVDGEDYWDGGYAANPPLTELVEVSDAGRILLVQIVPTQCDGTPTSSPTIAKRLNQITFNGPLRHDVAALETMKRLSGQDGGATALSRKLAALSLEAISAEDWVPDLARRSGIDLDRKALIDLRDRGRVAAAGWLEGADAERAA